MPSIRKQLKKIYDSLNTAEKTIIDPDLIEITQDLLSTACEAWADIYPHCKHDGNYNRIESLYDNLNDYYSNEGGDDEDAFCSLAKIVRNAKDAIYSKIQDEDDSSEDDESELIEAVKRNDLDEIKCLIRQRVKINQFDSDGQHAIMLAKSLGHIEIADFLEEKIIHRQKRSSLRFFDINRSHKQETHDLEKLFNVSRTKKDKTIIPIKGVPARRVVMADAGVIQHALDNTSIEKLTSRKEIVEELHWYNKGYEKSGVLNANWTWEYLSFPELTISSQYKPEIGHLGNFFMRGIGDYGTNQKDILAYIYEVTKDDSSKKSQPDRERKLAKLFLECLKTGDSITTEKLKDNKFPVYTKEKDRCSLLEHLNRILILTGIKEITRRWCSPVDLPLSIAYIQGLTLIADGHLKMKDIFDKNAPYGLPTATSIQSSHVLSAAKEKLKKLNLLFLEKYPEIESREDWHQLLLGGYGGVSDSEGESYTTSDDESDKADDTSTLSTSSDSSGDDQETDDEFTLRVPKHLMKKPGW